MLQGAAPGPRRQGPGADGTRTLSHALSTDPLQIDPLLDILIRIDWVGRLDEAGEGRHVLLADPDRTPAEPLIAAQLARSERRISARVRRFCCLPECTQAL
jgi:membrane protein